MCGTTIRLVTQPNKERKKIWAVLNVTLLMTEIFEYRFSTRFSFCNNQSTSNYNH